MSAAVQKSLITTLREELKTAGSRIYNLILGTIKTRDRLKQGFDRQEWYYAEEIGDYIADLCSGSLEDSNQLILYLLDKKERDAPARNS